MKKCGQCGIDLKRAKNCYYCSWKRGPEIPENAEIFTKNVVFAYVLLVLSISALVSLKIALYSGLI